MKGNRTLAKDVVFFSLCLVVLATAAIDSYLNLAFMVSSAVEKNPLAAAVLDLTGQNHYFLMSLKLFTTGLSVMVACFFYFYRTYMGMTIAGSMACFMTLCMFYMLV